MTLQSLSAWLRCPNCFLPLEPVPASGALALGCASGHRYDANRRGYMSLLPPRSKLLGDTARMLDERDALLASGVYSPIADAVLELAQVSLPAAPAMDDSTEGSRLLRVLDSGCGTGWYLHQVLDGLAENGHDARGLGSDLSPAAVQRAVRGRADVDGLVADVHAPLPVRDGVVDLVMAVFAPRNPLEFRRVLRPSGRLVLVVPRTAHLLELRAARPEMLSVPAGKAEALVDELAPLFSAVDARAVSYALPLDDERARQLIGMGPSAHHVSDASAATPLPSRTTVDVDVLAFAPLASG